MVERPTTRCQQCSIRRCSVSQRWHLSTLTGRKRIELWLTKWGQQADVQKFSDYSCKSQWIAKYQMRPSYMLSTWLRMHWQISTWINRNAKKVWILSSREVSTRLYRYWVRIRCSCSTIHSIATLYASWSLQRWTISLILLLELSSISPKHAKK